MSAPIDFGPMSRMLEQTMQALDTARGVRVGGDENAEPVEGHGEAADGLIRVKALPGGKLAELELDPRVMRMDSTSLSEAIVTAANAALADLTEQLRDGLAGPDLNTLADQLKEVQQESTRNMSTFLDALTDFQERIAGGGR
jgi:DNA-binding protein YbaB